MEFIELDGMRVSRLGLGTSNFCRRVGNRGPLDRKRALRLLELGFDRDINFIDTADIYGSEELVGQFASGRREKLVLATKFGFRMEGLIDGRMILEACNSSLRALKTNYIDLFQVHSCFPNLHEAELLKAGERLRKVGKIRRLGCANYTVSQLAISNAEARAKRVRGHASVQLPYSMVERRPLPSGPQRPKVLAFRVLGGGLLAGKRPSASIAADLSERVWRIASELCQTSRQLNVPAATLALLWVLQRTKVDMALVGVDSESQLLDAMSVFELEDSMSVLGQIDGFVPSLMPEMKYPIRNLVN